MRLSNPQSRPTSLFQEVGRLLRPFLSITIVATTLGILSGLATAWLLATVNEGLHAAPGPDAALLMRFALLCLLTISGSAVAGVANSVVGQRIISAMRKEISSRIMRSPLRNIEIYKSHRVLSVLSNDIDTVSAFTFNFAGYAVSLAVVIGCLGYIAILSPVVFMVFLVATVSAIGLAIYAKAGWTRDYSGVREAQDHLQAQYRAITEGAKEIRLNSDRRDQVLNKNLAGASDRIAELKISAMRRFWITNSLTSGIVFLSIGILLSLQTILGISSATTSGAIIVILYVRAPIEQLMNGLPAFFQAQISLRKIAEISRGFDDETRDWAATRLPIKFPFDEIALKDAVYSFPGEEGNGSFALGPINLKIGLGETLFIVGENGSGKTTLVKLLLGLYHPDEGSLLIDGMEMPEESLSLYRQMFSAVFSDYFLFADILSFDNAISKSAKAYLEDLEIAHKVNVQDNRFTTIDLSTGQRKRLALIHAYLEQRPIMMFDEWAADQDPTFRRVFYERILPDLKAQGKTLIVVSHDDRFFYAADHIVTLKDGVIINESYAREPITQQTSGYPS